MVPSPSPPTARRTASQRSTDIKKELIGSIDRITEQTAYIILNDDEHQLQIPLELLPDGADEGMAFTITIERNEEEEKRLAEEIATLKESLSQ